MSLSTKYLRALEQVAHRAGRGGQLHNDVWQVYQFLRLSEGVKYMNLMRSESTTCFKGLCKFFPEYIASWLTSVLSQAAAAAQLKPLLVYWLERNTSQFTAHCTTAMELDPELRATITSWIKGRYPDASVVYAVNPALVGGVKLVLPRFVIDATIARRLQVLRRRLGIVT